MRYTENLHLNLPEDSDPLDISKVSENFEKLDGAAGGESFRVGDILATLRTGLGGDWLPCNGGSFDPDRYPDLAEIGPGVGGYAASSTAAAWPTSVGGTNLVSKPLSMATDGEIVVFTAQIYTGNVLYTDLYYAGDEFSSIYHKGSMSFESGSSYCGYWTNVFYVNGYWILFSCNGEIYTTKDIQNEDGSTLKTSAGKTSVNLNSSAIQAFDYADGKYYIVSVSTNGPTVTYSNTPYFENFTNYLIPMTNYVTAASWKFVRTGTYFAFVGFKGDQITDIVYSASLTGSYQEIHIANQTQFKNPSNLCAAGDRIFWSYYDASSPGWHMGYIENIPGGVIGRIKLSSVPASNASSETANAYAAYIGGKYCFFGQNKCISVSDLNISNHTAYFLYSDLPNGSSSRTSDVALIRLRNTVVIALGGTQYSYPGAGTASKPDKKLSIPVCAVPNIDILPMRAYIKALNGGGSSGGGSSGGGGVSDHRLLTQRDAADQHPISAITGLSRELERIHGPVEALTDAELEAILEAKTACLVITLASGSKERTNLRLIPFNTKIADYSLAYSGTIPANTGSGILRLEPPDGYAFTGLPAELYPQMGKVDLFNFDCPLRG